MRIASVAVDRLYDHRKGRPRSASGGQRLEPRLSGYRDPERARDTAGERLVVAGDQGLGAAPHVGQAEQLEQRRHVRLPGGIVAEALVTKVQHQLRPASLEVADEGRVAVEVAEAIRLQLGPFSRPHGRLD